MKRLQGGQYIWQLKQWPQFSFNPGELLELISQARLAQGALMQAIRTLGFGSKQDSEALILTEEAITTAAIEGEHFDRRAVRSSVARRLGLPTAGFVSPNRTIEGLIDVLQDATHHYQKPLTAKRLKSWQAALFPTGYSGLYKIRTGLFRGHHPMRVVSGSFGREKIHFEAPPYGRLQQEISQFIKWWNGESLKIDGLLRAGVAHFYFVTIHPFEDGNGRIARALTDMALAQDEKSGERFYSLSSRINMERNNYYQALEESQKGSLDITLWLRWFLGCYYRAIQDSQKLISHVLAKSHFWQAHAEFSLNSRQKKVINKLLDVGPTGFIGGISTRRYTSMAKVSRVTAFRELTDLVKKGILVSTGGGRSVAYRLN